MNAADIKRAETIIDKSGLVSYIETRIDAHKTVTGRPRELSVRTLMVALYLLSETGTMHLVRIPSMLNSLDNTTKKRLGLTRQGGVTRRQVERLYNLIADALETSNHTGIDAFCDLLLEATLDKTCSDTRSIAVDATSIDSWGTRRKTKDGYKATDPDAAWRRKSLDNPWKKPVFGFDLTIAATVPERDGPDVPLAARAMRFRPANKDNVAMGRAVVKEVARQQGVLGDVIADREYTSTMDGRDFVLPVRALGGEPVFELTQKQLGARGTTHGAVMIDGHPFSPSVPPALQLLTPPPPGAPWSDVVAYQTQIETRQKYALVPHGSRKTNGSQVYQCPAAAGNLYCPLVSSGTPGAFPAVLAPTKIIPGTVCAKKYTTFHATDAPLSQRDLLGTATWYQSMSRRSRVEGFFGNLKNEARQNMRRGTIRVRGLVKTGMLVAFAVASTNSRLAETFAKRTPKATVKRRGRPKKVGVIRYVEVFTQDATPNAPPVT